MHAWVVGSLEQRRGKWAKHGIFGSLPVWSAPFEQLDEDVLTNKARLPKIPCFAHFPLRCSSDPTTQACMHGRSLALERQDSSDGVVVFCAARRRAARG